MGFWDPILVRRLAAQRPVIMFDQPGIGESPGGVKDVPETRQSCLSLSRLVSREPQS